MFDYHMHSTVSFDGHDNPEDMLRAAAKMGLKEICFTDHLDYDPLEQNAVDTLFNAFIGWNLKHNLCHNFFNN